MASLLCGAERYIALDIVRYAERARNLDIFEELVALFRSRADIPGETEFPRIQPPLRSYAFPADILTPERLEAALKPERLEAIRGSITELSEREPHSAMVRYQVPWDGSSIPSASVDLALSQSVLEFSRDLAGTYAEMARWLKIGGVMSHEIDFKSLGITREWNGHWACPDALWRLAVGNRRHRLNREPCSKHVELAEIAGCRVVSIERTRRPSDITRAQVTTRFHQITDDDLTTSSALIQASKETIKRNECRSECERPEGHNRSVWVDSEKAQNSSTPRRPP